MKYLFFIERFLRIIANIEVAFILQKDGVRMFLNDDDK